MAQGMEVHQMTKELHVKNEKKWPIFTRCRSAAFSFL